MKTGIFASISLAALLALSPVAYAEEPSSTKSDVPSDTGKKDTDDTTPADTATNEKHDQETNKKQKELGYVIDKKVWDEATQYRFGPSEHPK
jgi:hypothetical protein